MDGTAEVYAALLGLMAYQPDDLEVLMGTATLGNGSTVPVHSHVTDRSDVYSLGAVLRQVMASCYWAPDVAGMPTCTLLDDAIRIVGSCMKVMPLDRPSMATLASDLQSCTARATAAAAGP